MAVPEITVGVVVLLVVLAIYVGSAGFWIVETVFLSSGVLRPDDDFEHGPDDVQVRISTIDDAAVVQATVNSLPARVTDIHVIAEAPIEVDGATVHVVPESFTCRAEHKGRALEWARRNVPCDREYVLYLDEDTLVTSFRGVPDADIVQFTELPLYTGSVLTYLCEVFRIGYQFEQRSFDRLRYPLYVWGGGLAVRQSLEDRITWDRDSITEDTAFVWTAAAAEEIDLRLVDTRFRNQAPSTLRGLVKQRRRWMSGTREDAGMLSLRYNLFVKSRAAVWALSPVIVVLAGGAVAVSLGEILGPSYGWISLALLAFLHLIMAIGARIYRFTIPAALGAVVSTVPTVVLNTVGATWGFLSPISEFAVTEKVDPSVIEQRHPNLESGDLTEPGEVGVVAPPRLRDFFRRD